MNDGTTTDDDTLRFHAEGYDKKFKKYYQLYKFPNVRSEQATAIILSTEVAASDSSFFKKLAEEGFHVPTTFPTRKALLKSLETQRNDNRSAKGSVVDVTEQIGWLFGEFKQFVLPYRIFGNIENEVKLLGKHLPPESFSLSGSLEGWQSNVVAACTDNNNLMFSVATAFAPPLMRLLNIESGGFQFVGRSSIGKTTAMRTATSVWGRNMATWNGTIQSVSKKAICFNDSLLPIDETGQSVEPKEILTAIYQLAGGQGRDRLTDDNALYNWRIIFLSSSENNLDQLAKQARMEVMDGQRARLVDIGAEISTELGAFEEIHDSDSPKGFADALNNACMKYYGTAGKAYLAELVAWITKDQPGLREWLQKRMVYYNRRAGTNHNAGTQGRIAERFALVYAAGRLAHEFDIVPWKMDAMFEAINHCHKRVLLPEEAVIARATQVQVKDEDCILHVRSYIAKNRKEFNRYKPEAKFTAATLEASKGIIYKGLKGKTEYLFTPEHFRNAICGEYPMRAVISSLRAHGLLLGKEGGNAQRPLLKGKSTTRVIAIKSKIRSFCKPKK